jgi:hypothetical protein
VAGLKLAKRLKLLENKFSSAEITLWMANGSTRRVRARRLIQMIPEIMSGGPMSPDTTAVIDSVRDNCKAAGEGHFPELLKVLYAGRGEGPRVADISILSPEEREQVLRIGRKLSDEPVPEASECDAACGHT